MKSLYRIGNALLQVIKIYPMPLLAALLAYFLIMVQLHAPHWFATFHKTWALRLTLEVFGAMLLFFTADIIARWYTLDFAKHAGLYLLILCCLGLHFFSIDPVFFDSDTFLSRYVIFFILYFLSIGLATYIKPKQNDLFWKYNFRFIRTLVQSLGFSVVLLLGLLSAYWAIDNLFGMNFNEKGYADIAAFVLIVVHGFLFLIFFPAGPKDIDTELVYPEWLRVLAQCILLPVVVIYGSFLYIYVIKILLEHRMPNGWVSIPILVYSAAGILAYSLLYPFRNQYENRMVHPFMRYFFYTLLPLITLYFIAIYLRIKPYGITENRYMLAMIGVWLSGISIYHILKKDVPLAIIPQTLFLMLSLSVIGPWGMYQTGVRSQTKRLKQLLHEGNYWQHQQFNLEKQYPEPTENQAIAFRSVLDYLNDRNELMQLHPWLDPKHQVWLSRQLQQHNSHEAVIYILQRLHMESIWDRQQFTVNFATTYHWGTGKPLPLTQAGQLILVQWREDQFVYDGQKNYSLNWQNDTLVYLVENQAPVYWPFANALKTLRHLKVQSDQAQKQNKQSANSFAGSLLLNDSINPFSHQNQRLFVNDCNVVFESDTHRVEQLHAYWFIPNAPQ
ncbi:MAG: DUF4153 domain-containing protein [Chitinophagaceae bacterium]|nr:DUF4153 domain-containing protein [Chitinophagaceae bacterium]